MRDARHRLGGGGSTHIHRLPGKALSMIALREIGEIIITNLSRVWPLLVVSIPFAVLIRVSGIADKLEGAFGRRPILSILIATAAGAFSPLCSCTVIPVIASMLLSGIPLPAVMSFWIASPTMDPEIFFMGVAFLGWDLAVARLVATLAVSLGGGFITLVAVRRGWIGSDFMRIGSDRSTESVGVLATLRRLRRRLRPARLNQAMDNSAGSAGVVPQTTEMPEGKCSCSTQEDPLEPLACECDASDAAKNNQPEPTRLRRLLRETLRVTLWIGQLMLIAFALEAVILTFIPQDAVVRWIGTGNGWAPLLAALVGIPLYTGNLMAIPLMGGLLEQGMAPAGVLAFLIAGPVTTIPAMAAVWGVVRQRVFWLYIAIGLIGAIALGYLYAVVDAL